METMYRVKGRSQTSTVWTQLCTPPFRMQINILKIFFWLCWSPTLRHGRGKPHCALSPDKLTCAPTQLSHTLRNVQMGNCCRFNSCQVETCLVITDMCPSHFASWTLEGKQYLQHFCTKTSPNMAYQSMGRYNIYTTMAVLSWNL